MAKKLKVAVIGAGSAGLSALRQVKEQTDNYVIIDQTPLGTKCARTGCMPSKALIQITKDYHRRHVLSKSGIQDTDSLQANIPAVLKHVRSLRDHFSNAMVTTTRDLAGSHLITGWAEIIEPQRIRVGDLDIHAEQIIIATGSRPTVPRAWEKLGDRILTSDTLFEQQDLPRRIAIIGLGPIGLEIGQALSRLGLEVTGFDAKPSLSATTDPAVSANALAIFKQEFPIFLDANVTMESDTAGLNITHGNGKTSFVDAAVVAVGVTPQLDGLGLENLNIPLDDKGLPPFNRQTMQVGDLPVFIAGDVNGCRPILHEALDEGLIAGCNSVSNEIQCYRRRTTLRLVFSDPQIAVVGKTYQQLKDNAVEFIIGEVDFQEQARAILEQRHHGLLHIYADSNSAKILGAELVCPDAEHLAHQLAMAVQHKLTVFEMLQAPFYHPTVEEAIRTAIQGIGRQLSNKIQRGLSLCDSCPESPLC